MTSEQFTQWLKGFLVRAQAFIPGAGPPPPQSLQERMQDRWGVGQAGIQFTQPVATFA